MLYGPDLKLISGYLPPRGDYADEYRAIEEELTGPETYALKQRLQAYVKDRQSFHTGMLVADDGEQPIYNRIHNLCEGNVMRTIRFLSIALLKFCTFDEAEWVLFGAGDGGDERPEAQIVVRKAIQENLNKRTQFLDPGVSSHLHTALSEFKKQREECILTVSSIAPPELNAELSTLVGNVERVAADLLAAVQTLSSEENVQRAREAWIKMRQVVPKEDHLLSEGMRQLVKERISVDIAQQSLEYLDESLRRYPKLIHLMQDCSPSKRAASFLMRVCRCYLLGLDLECFILCRGVLDSEFDAHVSLDDLIAVLGQRRPLRYDLSDRIAVATRTGKLDAEGQEAANRVRERGNRAAHGNVESSDVLAAISDTLTAIRILNQSESS